jgi:hypothetical protein
MYLCEKQMSFCNNIFLLQKQMFFGAGHPFAVDEGGEML